MDGNTLKILGNASATAWRGPHRPRLWLKSTKPGTNSFGGDETWFYSDVHMKRWVSFGALLLSTLLSVAQNPPSQRELNGILLGQRREVMIAEFGKPFSSAPHKGDGGIQEAYAVSPDQKTYMACEYAAEGNGPPLLLQLTGNPNPKTLPFLGLRLGDLKDKVMKALGKPSTRKREKEFPVELWEYDDRNYSVGDRSVRGGSIAFAS